MLVGIALNLNDTGVIPIVEALKMSVAAISQPEMIIFRMVLKPKLKAIFTGILFVSFIGVGFLFNMVLV